MNDVTHRVLIVSHADELGGAERVLLRNAAEMDRSLFSLDLACPSDGPFAQLARQHGIPVHLGHPDSRLLGIERRNVGGITELPRHAWGMLTSLIKLTRLIRAGQYDLVLTNSAKADIYGSVAGWLARRPVAWRLHDIVDEEAFSRPNREAFRWTAKLFATKVLAVSDAVGQALMDLGVDPRKIATVYNGFDVIEETRLAKASDARAELGIDPGTPVAGFVGRIVPWKGAEYFIRAAAEIAREVPNAKFLLVGDTVMGNREDAAYAHLVRQLASDLDLDDRIIFTGWRDDVPALIDAMDVLVHTSVQPEPLGSVLLEAMSLGKPVVGAREGGNPEIVVEGETGYLVDPTDSAAVARATTALLREPVRARRMGSAGRTRVNERFRLDIATRDLEAALLHLIGAALPSRQMTRAA